MADEESPLAIAAMPTPWAKRLGLGIIATAFALGAGFGVALVATQNQTSQIAPATTDLTSTHLQKFCASFCKQNYSCLEDVDGPDDNTFYHEYKEEELDQAKLHCPSHCYQQKPCSV